MKMMISIVVDVEDEIDEILKDKITENINIFLEKNMKRITAENDYTKAYLKNIIQLNLLKPKELIKARNAFILQLMQDVPGMTVERVGQIVGLTRQSVYHIMWNAGVKNKAEMKIRAKQNSYSELE